MSFIKHYARCCYSKATPEPNPNQEEEIHTFYINREYVDLGLPSGTLWAKYNVGADSETEYGLYYKYGMGASSYSFTRGLRAEPLGPVVDPSQPDYYQGTEDPLSSSVDTAKQIWRGNWHTPTKTQLQELINNTTYTWENNFKNSGINGGKFTSSNGKYIFIPAAGKGYNKQLDSEGSKFIIWSSTPYSSLSGDDDAYALVGENNNIRVSRTYREYGCSIRAVADSIEEQVQLTLNYTGNGGTLIGAGTYTPGET